MPEKKKTAVPRLRFPEFRDAGPWKVKRLGDAYRFKPTNSWSRDQLNYVSGTVKNIHYGDIHKGLSSRFKIGDEVVPYVNDELTSSISEEAFCEEGDIVFADASEDVDDIGKAIEIIDTSGQRLVSGLHTILASQIDSKIVVGFGAYLFASSGVRKQIQQRAQGAKVLGISKTQLAEVKLAYPPEAIEQQKIADCLSSLDDLIRAEESRLEALQAHKKGLIQQLFPREGETTPRLRFPEFRNAGPWEVKRLGEVFDFLPTNSFSRDMLNYEDGDVKNIHYGDIHTKFPSHVNADREKIPFVNRGVDLRRVSEENYCVAGDVIIADASEDVDDIGKTIEIINPGAHPLLSGLHTIHARPTPRRTTPGFSGWMFQSASIRSQIQKEAQGAKVLGLSRERLARVFISFPSTREQQKIADCLSSLDDLIRAEEARLEALQAHKKGLMQQLFPQEVD